MKFQRENQSSVWSPKNSPAQQTSQFASRSFAIQPQQKSGMPPTQEQIENEAFEQQKFEATGLEIKQKDGSITPQEHKRLGVLQAKMDGLLAQRVERASRFGHNFANITVLPSNQSVAAPIQAKLTIGQPGDKYEQEADSVAHQVVSQINQPQSHTLQREQEMMGEEDSVQTKPEITLHHRQIASLQRSEMMGEQNPVQMASGSLQRQEMSEEDEQLQMKPMVQLSNRATEVPPIQCRILITPDAYARGLGAGTQNLTEAQITEYFSIAVQDDLHFALKVADEQKKTELLTRTKNIKAQTTSQGKVDVINELVTTINTVLDDYQIYEDKYNLQGHGKSIALPNRKTRYATNPTVEDYVHSSLSTNKKEKTKWGEDPKMWENFTKEIAEDVSQDKYKETNPRGKDKLPLKQLPWEQAKKILPKPLINLIFDVRFQLETNGNVVIDERTPLEQHNKQKSPNAPGTLRSWHQDTPGLLPENNFAPQNIPAHATALHQHYNQKSQSGAGSSTKNPITSPQGYAEYTGTGSNWEHNTKIVLDYINKRVYLTLTHYQYWALINENGTFNFWNSGGQDLEQAKGKLEEELKNKREADPILMSPWVEILMP